MTHDVRTMSVREFLRGGYRETVGQPIVVLNGGEVAGSWFPGASGIAVNFTGAQSLVPPGSVSTVTASSVPIPAAPRSAAAGGDTNGALPAEAPAQASRRPQPSLVQAVPKAGKQQPRGDAPKRPAKTGRRALPDLTRRA